jgi:hypothetical protein
MQHPDPGVVDPPGDHLCAFYRGPAERDRLMSGFLRDGLQPGHACLCVSGDDASQDMLAALADTDTSRLDSTRSRLAHPPSDAEPDPVLTMIGDWSRATSERADCSFARVVTDMTWALPDGAQVSADNIASYEASATTWTTSYPQSCVCLYDLDRFGSVVLAVIKAHPRVWMSGVMLENPYTRVVPAPEAAGPR